jgi:hypothetical protein
VVTVDDNFECVTKAAVFDSVVIDSVRGFLLEFENELDPVFEFEDESDLVGKFENELDPVFEFEDESDLVGKFENELDPVFEFEDESDLVGELESEAVNRESDFGWGVVRAAVRVPEDDCVVVHFESIFCTSFPNSIHIASEIGVV